jgi:hypothetical protein
MVVRAFGVIEPKKEKVTNDGKAIPTQTLRVRPDGRISKIRLSGTNAARRRSIPRIRIS